MRHGRATLLLPTVLVLACAGSADRRTLAELHQMEPDMSEVVVDDSLDQAIRGYRSYIEEAPESALTPEAMRRLADLKLEKEYGILGGGGGSEMAAPEEGATPTDSGGRGSPRPRAAGIPEHEEAASDFERRASAAIPTPGAAASGSGLDLPGAGAASPRGPLEAIELYDRILETHPGYRHADQVLYQKARAYDELGRPDEAIEVIERLIAGHPHSRHIDEVQFRRAEYFFTRRKYLDAEEAYAAIAARGPGSDFYELALYKLGWTFYKQYLYEEALDQYVALLDYKVSSGYDFDQAEDEGDERRIADTFRVISLSFSELGGPEVVEAYFAEHGERSYEDRVYSHLGEFYLDKLRYHDAAAAYRAFVDLHPLHRSSPHFSMRVVEIHEKGGFPKLVLESKKDFAARYGLQSGYWRHFEVSEAPEVLSYLKANLEDLASHYHAVYQETARDEEKPESFREALRWYRAYLGSFPGDPETPGVHRRLADLLLENRDFGEAAREYERTAYDYPEHDQAAEAGYAAIYAHREHEKASSDEQRETVRRRAVTSTLRFVDAFPQHEHAAAVLGAAVDDLYDMQELERAIATGRRLIDAYPEADPDIRRSAWATVGHACFDLADYPSAEDAYARVLESTPEDDASRPAVVDNLAASIYQQGEQASGAGEHRAAAGHFLRIAEVAPGSAIRPTAEYDASAALIRLEDWDAAIDVLEAFRGDHPGHELQRQATRQMAFVRRQQGDLAGAAAEYERVAEEAEAPDKRREALLTAGGLYEEAGADERALAVYLGYVAAFPEPLEAAVETRFTIAQLYEEADDDAGRREQLARIVELDRRAGGDRTPRVRHLAARSALILAERAYRRFEEVELVQPFERNLQEKQRRMRTALETFGDLVDYEVGEATAGATFYMAEIYYGFSQALLGSERPEGLGSAELLDYEMALEEEAFPFEEKALAVHEKNVELMRAGVWNRWVEKSLGRLAKLMPGRYAKREESSGWIASLDRYAYQPPGAPAAEPGEAEASAAAPEDAAGRGEVADAGDEVPAGPEEPGETAAPPASPAPQAGSASGAAASEEASDAASR